MPLRETLTSTWDHIQGFLFPMLRVEVGPLTAQHERFVIVLEVACIEAFVQVWPGLPGRPPKVRHALARAFVAKAVLNLPTTSGLIERLAVVPGRAFSTMRRYGDCAATSGSARFPARAPFRAASPSSPPATCRPGFTRR